jgi:hypothetical protein
MKRIILTLALFIMNFYYAQSLKDFDLNTKTLDLKVLNESENRGGYTFYLDNDIKVYQRHWGDEIRERITRLGDPYYIERTYYPDGKLSYAKRLFYGFGIGVTQSFDKNGNKEEGINWDYKYTFSEVDLIKKMKEEYGIDLSVYEQGKDVGRTYVRPEKDGKPRYTVSLYGLEKDSLRRDGGIIQIRRYYISGINGSLMKIEEEVYMGKNAKSALVYRDYEMDGKKEVLKITETTQTIERTSDVPARILEKKVIYERPGSKEGAYRIYKGKKYTEEEWEKFEQKLFEKYARKHNSPLTPNEDKNEDKGKLPPSRFLMDN